MAEDDISELLSPWDRLTTLDTENPAKSPPYLPSVVVAGGGGRDKYDPTTCYVLLSDISRFLFQQQSIIWQHWCLLGAVRDTKYQNCDMEAAEGSELALVS